jgi:hypothetical protein
LRQRLHTSRRHTRSSYIFLRNRSVPIEIAQMEEGMKSNRALTLGLASAVIASPVVEQKKSVEPIKVYVFTATNPSDFTDSDQKQRVDSLGELK